jgi:hypothetical protein
MAKPHGGRRSDLRKTAFHPNAACRTVVPSRSHKNLPLGIEFQRKFAGASIGEKWDIPPRQ